MSDAVNEILAARLNGQSALVPAQARELLNLRRLPAMLNTAQTAVLLGLADHDIPVLVRAGFLYPLGNPPPNAVKSFSTAHVLALAGEITALDKMRRVVYEYWRGKNAEQSRHTHTTIGRRQIK